MNSLLSWLCLDVSDVFRPKNKLVSDLLVYILILDTLSSITDYKSKTNHVAIWNIIKSVIIYSS